MSSLISRRAAFKVGTLAVVGPALSFRLPRVQARPGTPSADKARWELSPGFFLVEPRFRTIASGSIPAFVGEIVNDTGATFDAPVLGLTFFDGEGNIVGSHYATPVLRSPA